MADQTRILRTPEAAAAYCRELRDKAKLTQAELAKRLGYRTAQVVANAENGRDASRTGIRIQIIEHLERGARATEAIVVEHNGD